MTLLNTFPLSTSITTPSFVPSSITSNWRPPARPFKLYSWEVSVQMRRIRSPVLQSKSHTSPLGVGTTNRPRSVNKTRAPGGLLPGGKIHCLFTNTQGLCRHPTHPTINAATVIRTTVFHDGLQITGPHLVPNFPAYSNRTAIRTSYLRSTNNKPQSIFISPGPALFLYSPPCTPCPS